jgi:uncharacterized membrane protein YbhN (UPF0104 family)
MLKVSQRWLWAGKFAFGAILFAIIATRVELSDLLEKLRRADVVLCLVAFIAFGVTRLWEAVRFYFVIGGRRVPFWRVAEMVWVATFFNNFALSVVGDGYRAYALRNWLPGWSEAISTIVLDRVLGTFVILLVFAAYLLFDRQVLELLEHVGVDWTRVPSGAVLGVEIAAAVLLVALAAAYFTGRLSRLGGWLVHARQSVPVPSAGVCAIAFASTLAAQVSIAAMTALLVEAFGETAAFGDVFLVMLIVHMTAFLPVSIGALGVREGILVLGLPAFGVSAPTAVSVALISRFMLYVYAAAGGVWLVMAKRRQASISLGAAKG